MPPASGESNKPSSGKVPTAAASALAAAAANKKAAAERGAGPVSERGGHGPESRPAPNSDQRHEYRAGEIIEGKYQLSRLLGEGGMGAVWLARNMTLDVDIALKLIRRERASPEAAQRLLQEARAAARLGHPSIVRVFDFGFSEHNDPYIVMEVLNGESLRDLLARKKRLTPERAVRTLMPIASALVSAHSRGIVHRDLKPDNIILMAGEREGVVPKIVDFGIAKLHHTDMNIRFTLTGQIMGSPGYMSPEQLDGRADIDQRTDVWTFSVVLYEAATGQRPFDGAHYNAMLSAILLREPVPTTQHGAGDAELWSILARGLAKDSRERWQSMREMGAALARWAVDRGIQNDIMGSSLSAHWLQISEGPPSDAPPPDHEVIFTDPGADDMPPTELQTDLPPRPRPISNMTPIPDTEPAAMNLLQPTFPPPPAVAVFANEVSLSRPVPMTTLPGAVRAPTFGPRPPMPSYIPLPMEPVEAPSIPPPARGPSHLHAPPSARALPLGGPLAWIAALAFVIGIGATWFAYALSRSEGETTAGPGPSMTAGPTTSGGQPAGIGTLGARDSSATGDVGLGTSPTAISPSAPPSASPVEDGPGPFVAIPSSGLNPPGTSSAAPSPTLQPKTASSAAPSASVWKPVRPRSSAMPLPSAPNF